MHLPQDVKRYLSPLVVVDGETVRFTDEFRDELSTGQRLRAEVDDLLITGEALIRDRYLIDAPFTTGMQSWTSAPQTLRPLSEIGCGIGSDQHPGALV